MTMSLARPSATPFEWRRVGAFSISLAAHLAAFALILMPLAPPVRRTAQHAIEVSWIEAPPPVPEIPLPPEVPPPPKPPRRMPVAVRPQPLPVPPDTAPAQTPSVPVADAPSEPAVPRNADVAPAEVATAAGETRQLAYDAPLRLRYPAPSIRAREQGTVVLRVRVDAEGRVERIEVARSSGHPKLDAAAREAVQRSRFKPVLIAGKPMPAWGLVPIEFRLDRT